MNPGSRAPLSFVFLSLVSILIGGAPASAQSQPAPTPAVETQTASAPQKPVHKSHVVATDDTVVLLGVHRAPKAPDSAKPSPAVMPKPTPNPVASDATTISPAVAIPDANASASDTEKQAAEIASLQKQIQDKTKRITFLMRLFVTDERAFLNDPSNSQVDPDTQERRKYSQDELLYETAELARLQSLLNQLTAR